VVTPRRAPTPPKSSLASASRHTCPSRVKAATALRDQFGDHGGIPVPERLQRARRKCVPNWRICASAGFGTDSTTPANIRRSARFGIHVGRIVGYVRLQPRMRRYSVQRLGRHARSSRPWPGPGLSFGLIHPRTGPFTGGHPDRVRAARGRWRMPVNVMQHCWKACWGQPLAGSNLASSATADLRRRIRIMPARCATSRLACLIFCLS
jgi:hypothetical protein